MASKPARQRSKATGGRKRPVRSRKPAPRPISAARIDELPTTDIEPTDAVDLAETARPMSPQAAKEIALAAGDLDARIPGMEAGDESADGADAVPELVDVDRIGTACGVVEQDEKPLATTEKIEGRDRQRWELDPASSEDYDERQREQPVGRRRRQR